MKKYIKSMALLFASLLAVGTLSSCEDYLDKDPDSDITEDTPFKNYNNLQGYVDEIYNCIPDKAKCYWTTAWNLGEDEIMNPNANGLMVNKIDLGDFFAWQGNTAFWFGKQGVSSTNTDEFQHSLYGHAWYCIYKCNMALSRLDKYFVGTQEEKDMVKGQLYFFRAWWHFEMMEYLGGLPYITEELDPTVVPNLARLSFQECADKCAADLKRASELLPTNWDDTKVGKNTLGKNDLRINKITALCYLGKVYLWAASPLMQPKYEKNPPTDGSHTYEYNLDYARKAAEALGEVLTMVENNETQYALAGFSYENIYDHIKTTGEKDCYSDLFFTYAQGGKMPGASEAIFRGPSKGWSYTRYNYTRLFGPNSLCVQDNHIHQPTANYIDDNYGMANGLPLSDPESGWDPNFPFRGRDPRFYHDIIFDGVRYIGDEAVNISKADSAMLYAGLATGGSMRAVENASRTGYFYQKLVPHKCHKYHEEDLDSYSAQPHAYIPYMRLADVYLMYAEATAAIGGPKAKAANCRLTSVDAINTLRLRCGAAKVNSKFTGNAYMDEVRRERAVELAFEGFRFNDLQRWLLLTVPKYTVKKSAEFIRLVDDEWLENKKNDPRDAQVADYHYETILTRKFDAKHYWFPLYRDDVYIASEFEQNPGW